MYVHTSVDPTPSWPCSPRPHIHTAPSRQHTPECSKETLPAQGSWIKRLETCSATRVSLMAFSQPSALMPQPTTRNAAHARVLEGDAPYLGFRAWGLGFGV